MIEAQFLPYFITEELVIVNEAAISPKQKTLTVTEGSPSIPKLETVPHMLMVLSTPMSAEDKALLGKILLAIQFQPEQVPMHESIPQDVDFENLIVFGKEVPLNQSAEIALFTPYKSDGKLYLKAPALSTFHGNDALKKQLWLALKQIFPNK